MFYLAVKPIATDHDKPNLLATDINSYLHLRLRMKEVCIEVEPLF